MRKKIILTAIAAAIYILLRLLLNSVVQPEGILIDRGWSASHGETTGNIEIPFRKNLDSSEIWRFSADFADPLLTTPTLVLIRPLTYAFEVRINGETVHRQGNLDKPTGNFWNSCFAIPVECDLSGQNNIEIITAGLHVTGFPTAPYFSEWEDALIKAQRINFLMNDLLKYSTGGSLLLGIILILLSVSRRNGPDTVLFMGITAAAAAVYCLDYQHMIFTGSLLMFMQLKKTFLLCGYAAAGCFLISLNLYSDKNLRLSKPITILTIAACLIVGSAWNFNVLYTFFNFSNIILLLNLLIGNFILLKMSNTRESFLVPLVMLTLSIAEVLLIALFNSAAPLTLQYILLVTTIFFSSHILLDYRTVVKENHKLIIGINQDPLTGVFNRSYLKNIHPADDDRIVMIDIDNFKYYNDTYGHQKGDELLIQFVGIVHDNLRNNDLMLRLGGDEFLIFLSDVDDEQTNRILERIEEQFRTVINEPLVGFSYGISPKMKNIKETIAEADMEMYRMKRKKKN